MNIKKIIREIIENTEDDWSWANFDPIKPRKKGEIRVGDVYTIYGNEYEIRYQLEITEVDGDLVMYEILITSNGEEEPVGEIDDTEHENAKRLIKNGYWVLTNSFDINLTESEEGGVDPFDWIRESDPSIKLKPNTLYYFEPNIGGDEMVEFTNRFVPGYKNIGRWLRGLKDRSVKYFVTDETGKDTIGWCNVATVEDALETIYEDGEINVINARDYFNI